MEQNFVYSFSSQTKCGELGWLQSQQFLGCSAHSDAKSGLQANEKMNVKKEQRNHAHNNNNVGTRISAWVHNGDMRLEFIALIM